MRLRRRSTTLLTAGLAALLLAGCGGSDEGRSDAAASSSSASDAGSSADGQSDRTGPEVAADAADALEEAGAVHVAGTTTSADGDGTLDFVMQDDDLTGSITIGGLALQLLRTDGSTYMQGTADYWQQAGGLTAEEAAMLDGVWVLVPTDVAAEFDVFSLSALAQEFRQPDETTNLDEVTEAEFQGQPVLVVHQEDGSTIDVAAEGTPYPLHTVGRSAGADAAELTLDRFGERQTITAPADALDISQFAP